MKKIKIFLLCLLVSAQLFAQDNGGQISSQQIPLELQMRIGFMFVYALLGLLFLMLFAFYPRQRLNLFFGIFNLLLILASLNSQSFTGEPSALKSNVNGFISRLIGMNLLLFMLYALGRMKPFFWWFITFILFVDFPLNVIFQHKYDAINQVFHSVFTVICAWLTVLAFSTKKREDWLIGIIGLASVFINMTDLLLFFAKLDLRPYAGLVPFVITPTAVCYLALRYSRANTSLEQQLVQVKTLSEENVRREQEKQQLLATQNEMLERQVKQRTAEITTQKETLEHTLDELRSAQAQLIQSEKMASLGELTAGIAHEIQNPLNFVNNFSDVNTELADELKRELATGNTQSANEIADNIKDNERKINHHGKRADAIVKNMLQHSRTSSGQKELTDINGLAEEYFKLASHGIRAKDKSFNAEIKTAFDDSIGKINIVPQDIGRVLLNLINNAFYSVNEKQKSYEISAVSYEPLVSVQTKKLKDGVEITVEDNGNGIPDSIKEKIFQPFFTTKPTGQGTGLGLSLAYDIIKAHGGEITVATRDGKGSEFIIQLPAKSNIP
jgi:two-component system NtrC family sensor kinase